jgi:hypothetical protein
MVVAAMAAVAIVFFLAILGMRASDEAACNRVKTIAQDAEKMKYVREWVAKRTANKEFMALVVKYRWFEQFSPYTPQYIDIDWRYLGFDPRSAWVGFNVDDARQRGGDPVRILSVSLNQGRTGVILKLKPTDDVVGDLGPPGDPSTVTPIGDDVFIYCDFRD